MKEEKPIVFTVTKITDTLGGFYNIKTEDNRANGCTYTDIGIMQLYEIMSALADEFNAEGYAVLFEVD